ncbi:DNA cross-link repair 1A protein isoform X1 [Stigmatopora nigra]
MSQKTDPENDIWNYKPRVKTKKKRDTTACGNPARRKCSTDTKSVRPNEQCDGNSLSQNVDSENKGDVCPICQMPFSILLVQSQRWHVAECLDTPRDACPECPDGSLCSSSIPNHYNKFKHSQLAHVRATGLATPLLSHHNEHPSPNDHMDASPPSSTPSQTKNGLLLLRSPGPEDMKKKKGWSPKGRSSITFSQESVMAPVTSCQIPNSPDNDDGISYSPLSELPAEIGASDDEDLLLLLGEDEPVPDVIDCPEGGVHAEKVQSPQSKVLECLKESVSFVAPHRMETPRRNGLKQTDIGVFFGLKPLKTDVPGSGVVARQVSLKGRGKVNAGMRERDDKDVNGVEEETKNKRRKLNDNGQQPRQRWCPFYKKIPGTTFAVDAFHYGPIEGITAYFLTHFHSDHYGGLTRKSTFPIYCNELTAKLVKSKLKVDERFVHQLPMNIKVSVDGTQVVLLDANHCPGAAMLLFFLSNGQTVLHTGDFRADPAMEAYPELLGCRVHTLYLDTTYCAPEYVFPKQQEVIQFATSTALEAVTLHPRTLVVCGSYSVGKEKVFLALREVLGCKVCVSQDKYNTMRCLESEGIERRFTTDWKATRLHVLPMMHLNITKLRAHLNRFSDQYDHLLAFKPTGWSFSQQTTSLQDILPVFRDGVSIYGIPYSEHSSFSELKRFVQWLRPLKIIPTVNIGSRDARMAMEKHFGNWLTTANSSLERNSVVNE